MHFREGVVVQAVHLGQNTAIGEFFCHFPSSIPPSVCHPERERVGLQEMRPKESIVTVSLSLSPPMFLSIKRRKEVAQYHQRYRAVVIRVEYPCDRVRGKASNIKALKDLSYENGSTGSLSAMTTPPHAHHCSSLEIFPHPTTNTTSLVVSSIDTQAP